MEYGTTASIALHGAAIGHARCSLRITAVWRQRLSQHDVENCAGHAMTLALQCRVDAESRECEWFSASKLMAITILQWNQWALSRC